MTQHDPTDTLALLAQRAKLGEMQTEYFLLVYAHGWTCEQVAERFGVTVKTVRNSLGSINARIAAAQQRHESRATLAENLAGLSRGR